MTAPDFCQHFHCPACSSWMDMDEMATVADFGLPWITKIERAYRGPVCATCAEDHRECYECCSIVRKDEMDEVGGEWVCSDDCADDARRDMALDAAHVHAVRMELQGGKG